jgi:uncharacterized membrane protein
MPQKEAWGKWIMNIVGVIFTATVLGSIPWAMNIQANVSTLTHSMQEVAIASRENADILRITREELLQQKHLINRVPHLDAQIVTLRVDLTALTIELEKLRHETLNLQKDVYALKALLDE